METKKLKKDIHWMVELRQDWCKGCYFCVDVCPVEGIFSASGSIGTKGFVHVVVSADGCNGCKLCELLCPDIAITVEADESKD